MSSPLLLYCNDAFCLCVPCLHVSPFLRPGHDVFPRCNVSHDTRHTDPASRRNNPILPPARGGEGCVPGGRYNFIPASSPRHGARVMQHPNCSFATTRITGNVLTQLLKNKTDLQIIRSIINPFMRRPPLISVILG